MNIYLSFLKDFDISKLSIILSKLPFWMAQWYNIENKYFLVCYRFIMITRDQSHIHFYFQHYILGIHIIPSENKWWFEDYLTNACKLGVQVARSRFGMWHFICTSIWFQHLLTLSTGTQGEWLCAEVFQKHSFHFGKIAGIWPIQDFLECTNWLRMYSGVMLSNFQSQLHHH